MGELREHLIEKAAMDEAFRARLLSDPKAAVEEELGLTIPADFTLKVHESVPNISHLVLPPLAALDESALEQAAGGTDWDSIAEEVEAATRTVVRCEDGARALMRSG